MGNPWDLTYVTTVNGSLERRYVALKTSARLASDPRCPFPALGLVAGLGEPHRRDDGQRPIVQDVLTYPEYRDVMWNLPVGDLQQDARHRVRLWAPGT